MRKTGAKYLLWYDDNPKVPFLAKIEDAIDAYIRRFAITPTVVLVNQSEITEHEGVQVCSVDFVRHNNFWVGLETPLAVVASAEV